MKWLCMFLPHKWEHIVDIRIDERSNVRQKVGLYQCKRCQKMSRGTEIEKKIPLKQGLKHVKK